MRSSEAPSIEVLVVTVDGSLDLVNHMHVSGDVVVANQCSRSQIDHFSDRGGRRITHVMTEGLGVGRNRNAALQNAQADVALLADDDMEFVEDYESLARLWFDRLPTADVLIFNLGASGRLRRSVREATRVRGWGYFNFGAARIGFRVASVQKANIRFTELFGGGAVYSAGEDTLFLRDCLKSGLEIWAVPETLATLVDTRDSSWFTGFDSRYFQDKGALYFEISPLLWPLFSLFFAVRRRSLFQGSFTPLAALGQMLLGAVRYFLRYRVASRILGLRSKLVFCILLTRRSCKDYRP